MLARCMESITAANCMCRVSVLGVHVSRDCVTFVRNDPPIQLGERAVSSI